MAGNEHAILDTGRHIFGIGVVLAFGLHGQKACGEQDRPENAQPGDRFLFPALPQEWAAIGQMQPAPIEQEGQKGEKDVERDAHQVWSLS